MTRVELLPSHFYKAVVRTYSVLLREVFQMTVRLLSCRCCIAITCEMSDTRNPILLSDSSMSYLIVILIGLHVYPPIYAIMSCTGTDFSLPEPHFL